MGLKTSLCMLVTLLFLFMASLSPSSAETPPFTGEINYDNINIRSDSTTGSEIICQVNKGARVEVILELYDWYKIRLIKQAPSYVKKDFFECVNYENPVTAMASFSADKRCLKASAIKGRINVRLKPNDSSAVLGRLDENETVNIVKLTGEWYRIEPIKNSFGWINKKFVTKAPDIKRRE
jgi:uncharacterized protein YgiM (DUF1202 family)